MSILESKVTVYRPNETAKLAIDHELQDEIRRVSIRALAREAGISESTVKAARSGKRFHKAVVARLRKALGSISRCRLMNSIRAPERQWVAMHVLKVCSREYPYLQAPSDKSAKKRTAAGNTSSFVIWLEQEKRISHSSKLLWLLE